MTNAQIIFNARVQLMEAGKIGTTGRAVEVQNEKGETVIMKEPEEIHTFLAWKEKGYSVRKGEKAVAKFTIWKYVNDKIETEDGEAETRGKCFMKCAAFFSAAQVEKMGAA